MNGKLWIGSRLYEEGRLRSFLARLSPRTKAFPKNANTYCECLRTAWIWTASFPSTWMRSISDQSSELFFVGRLLPFKGVAMLLQAVARVHPEIPVSLNIVGDGPIRADLEKITSDLGLTANVTFAGGLSLAGVATEMRKAHVFCLPSVRESGGAVLLEAEASGLPVVAVNYGGPAELVDDEVGRAVSADGPESLIQDLVETFRDIARNPGTMAATRANEAVAARKRNTVGKREWQAR